MKKIFASLLILCAWTSYAQEGFKGEHFIEVTGSASVELDPNEIYTSIRLREFEENRQKTSLEKLDADFFNAIKEAGIEKKRVELSDAGSNLGKLGKRDKDSFREKTYQLKLTSAAELVRLVEKLSNVKVDYFDVTRVSHSDYEKIKLDLKAKALQNAKSKAEALLKSIGSELGKPLMVRDWEQEPVQPMMRMKVGAFNTEESSDADQTAFRKIKLLAQLTAQFEIK